MLLELLKEILFSLFVESGFLFAIIVPIMWRMMFLIVVKPNYCITDEKGFKLNAIKIDGRVYPPFDPNMLSRVKQLPIRKSDVLLCGYPKTGCHWTYEIMYMILNNKAKISKYGKAFGGMVDVMPRLFLQSVPSPRILNSHLLYHQLPVDIKTLKTKIVLTERNAKDTVVSFYNHHKNLKHIYGNYKGDFGDYFKLFMNGELDYGSYFDYTLDWHSVINSSYQNEVFVLCFEDLKKDPVSMIKKLANFLEVSITDEFAEEISTASSFKTMKKVRSSDEIGDKLFRKGTVGDWKNWMTNEQAKEIGDRWDEVQIECQAKK